MLVEFHQNDVTDAQGGIERYVDTLLAAAGDRALLVSEPPATPAANRIGLRLPRLPGPKWIPFALAVWRDFAAIRARLAACFRAILFQCDARHPLADVAAKVSGWKVTTTNPGSSRSGASPSITATSARLDRRKATRLSTPVAPTVKTRSRSEEHTSELQSH